MTMLPGAKPQLSRDGLLEKIHAAGHTLESLMVIGIRGYYRDTMGKPGANDRGIYDDAIFIATPDLFASYNANTDPSAWRKGSGTGAGKGMASLKPGLYRVHRCDLHKGKYEALCQRAGQVTVIRDGNPPYEDTGFFGINIHRGGFNTTSSEGCQTIHPSQYDSFIANVHDQVKRLAGAKWRSFTVPYLLMEG